MIKNVIHRDGTKDLYNVDKIRKAIEICLEVNQKTKLISTQQVNKILQEIDSTLHKEYNNKDVHVENIQDVVVKALNKVNESVAIDYQKYREKRDKIRDMNYNGKYYKTILELASCVSNEVSHENGNKDAVLFNVMRDLIAGETCKKIYKENIMSPYLLELHNKGVVHIHDLDYRLIKGMTNCSVPNLDDMLQNGTCINGKKINKPHRLVKAVTIATQIITGIANMQYGGITISMSALAPFINESRKYYEDFFNEKGLSVALHDTLVKKMVTKEIEDAIQTLLYQLNSMTSNNGQSPFITLFCYAKEKPEYENDTAMLILELFKQRYEGMFGPDGNNINPAFPKIVFAVEEEDKLYQDRNGEWKSLRVEAAKCTARRMVPDYMSVKISKQIKEGLVIPPINKSVA